MSRVFENVDTAVPEIIALSFIDTVKFLTCGRFAQNVTKVFQLLGKTIIE